jgi:hypothetical protein
VEASVVSWFQWKSNRVHAYAKDNDIKISPYFTSISAFTHFFFLMCFVAFVFTGGIRKCNTYGKSILWLGLIVWLSNILVTIFSVPIELRYQLFPMLTTFTFGVVLMEFMLQENKAVVKQKNSDAAPLPATQLSVE